MAAITHLLGVLLLHAALVSANMYMCPDVTEQVYTIIACGAPGLDGLPGLNGTDGVKGDQGDAGLTGVPGSEGLEGMLGLPGRKGDQGDAGPLGLPGFKGLMGRSGASGLKGGKGDSQASDALKAQIAALVAQVRDMQTSLDQQRLVSDLLKKTVRVGGKIYTSTGAQANYTEAMAICANAGGSLATPHNSTENDAILSIRNYYNMNVYLGINDLLNPGTFRYLTGAVISYMNWSQSEPNNLATEFCVEMYSTGKWNNRPCDKIDLVVCEF